jgi:hypothetical protein
MCLLANGTLTQLPGDAPADGAGCTSMYAQRATA